MFGCFFDVLVINETLIGLFELNSSYWLIWSACYWFGDLFCMVCWIIYVWWDLCFLVFMLFLNSVVIILRSLDMRLLDWMS